MVLLGKRKKSMIICFRAKRKKRENRLMSAAEAVLLSRQPLSVLRPVVLFESFFFAAFVFPSFFPSFFRTGLDLSSNKYQKLVLILVNTGQDNDKVWDELFL